LLVTGYFNGAAAAVTPAAGGYANPAALLTFANTAVTGWAAYGTWSLINNGTHYVLQLVSETVECADVRITLEADEYCFTFQAGDETVDGIIIGGTLVEFPAVTFSENNPEVLVNAIAPYLIGTEALEIQENGGVTYLHYKGLQIPTKLQYEGADVVGVADFAAGVCF
jgi:hypothetical protein